MRTSALGALGLVAVLSVPASAGGGTGPFAGSVVQGETRTHLFDNNPSNNPCLALAATYVVALNYVPGGDTLTLAVDSTTKAGSNGAASIVLTRGVCARFTIGVTGTSVASSATYAVTVTRQILPPITTG